MTTVPVWQLYQRPAEGSIRCVQSQSQHGRQTVLLPMRCAHIKLHERKQHLMLSLTGTQCARFL